jgi:hypothetical protein
MKMKKRMRKQTKQVAPKKVKVPMLDIPMNLKPLVRKKFHVRPVTGAWVLVTHTVAGVDTVVTLRPTGCLPQASIAATVRDFPIPSTSTLPVDMWRVCNRQLAIWWARWYARHGAAPSAKSERSRRKRIWKKAAARAAAHASTKSALQIVGALPKLPLKDRVVSTSAFICTYDPKAMRSKLKPRPTFELHRTDCTGLDQARNRAVRHGGDTWVIEAQSVEAALRLQLAEFDESDMGYGSEDFDVHICERDEYINSKGSGK